MFGPGPTGGGRYDVAFRGTSGVASVESWVRAPVRTGLQTFGPAGAGRAELGYYKHSAPLGPGRRRKVRPLRAAAVRVSLGLIEEQAE